MHKYLWGSALRLHEAGDFNETAQTETTLFFRKKKTLLRVDFVENASLPGFV